MEASDRVDAWSDELTPILAALGLELVDVEVAAGIVRVTVDREGGVDLEGLSSATRAVSEALDRLDPLPGRYTLEVSSPGLERRLRTPSHFARALGETVTVRLAPEVGPARRVTGRLAAVDDGGVLLEGPEVPGGTLSLTYEQIERARTVFEWGPGTRSSSRAPKSPGAARAATRERARTS